MKIVLAFAVAAGLVIGALALFGAGEPGGDVVSVTDPVPAVPAADVAVAKPVDAAGSKPVIDIATQAKTETEAAQDVVDDALATADTEVGVIVESLGGQGQDGLSNAPNRVKNALENVLGGAGVLGGSPPGANEDNLANLENDAINGVTWAHVDDALTVEGFDSLVISHALFVSNVDPETKEAVRSLLAVGERNPEQLQSVIVEIRKLLGF